MHLPKKHQPQKQRQKSNLPPLCPAANAAGLSLSLGHASMFRLLRTLILVMIAFIAGMLYEREGRQQICENGGGLWIEDICVGRELN